MVGVSNTSPLNYLVLIGGDHVLPVLFGSIVIPESVFDELHSASAPLAVQQWVAVPPPWLADRRAPPLPSDMLSLAHGEAEAISLAQAIKADLLLLDERKARFVARKRDLRVTGTLGILDAAAARGLIVAKSLVGSWRHRRHWSILDTRTAGRGSRQECPSGV